MGSDMLLRDLYLPADTTVDLAAAKTTAGELCRSASSDDLRILLDEEWISDDRLIGPDDWTDQALTARVGELRVAAERALHKLLDGFASSLHGRDVARFRFDNSTDSGGSVDAYLTGGPSSGCGPTDAYDAWDIVFDTDRFPHGWCGRLGAACGLLHPNGDAPIAALVMFHGWAAPNAGEAGGPVTQAPDTATTPSPAQREADDRADAYRAVIAASAAATAAALPHIRSLLPTGWHAICHQAISGATHTIGIDPPTGVVDATAYLIPHTDGHDGAVAGWLVQVHNRQARVGFPLYTDGGAHAAVFASVEAAVAAAITVLRVEAVPTRVGRPR